MRQQIRTTGIFVSFIAGFAIGLSGCEKPALLEGQTNQPNDVATTASYVSGQAASANYMATIRAGAITFGDSQNEQHSVSFSHPTTRHQGEDQ